MSPLSILANNKALCKIAILLLLSTACRQAAAQDWQLKKDEGGIQVFTGKTSNSSFKSIKVECTVTATASQLIAFLLDLPAQHDWVYNNKSTQLVKQISGNELIFYAEINAPWPCSNRDYISHIVINQPTSQLLTIDAHSEPDLLPQKEGIIRVRSSKAHWDVTKAGNDQLKIVYTVEFDPSGSVPAWLINMFVTKGPLQTFEKLKEGLSKSVNTNVHLDFIKEL
jgi:hypothetical protein